MFWRRDGRGIEAIILRSGKMKSLEKVVRHVNRKDLIDFTRDLIRD
jgi:hypothetical protein